MCNTYIVCNLDIITHRAAHENPVQRIEEQQWDLQHHREARSHPEYQAPEQQLRSMCSQEVRDSRQPTFRAQQYQSEHFYNTTDVGTLSVQCSRCDALKFDKETESFYCSKGNVQLD